MASEQLLQKVKQKVVPLLQAMLDPAAGNAQGATLALDRLFNAQPLQTALCLAQIGAKGTEELKPEIRLMALNNFHMLVHTEMGFGISSEPQKWARGLTQGPSGPSDQDKIQRILLYGVLDERDLKLRKSIAICLARWLHESLALDENSRPKSLSRMVLEFLQSPNPQERSTAFHILTHYPSLFLDCFYDGILTSHMITQHLVAAAANPGNSISMRMEALKAVVKVLFYEGDVIQGDDSQRNALFDYAFECASHLPWELKAEGIELLDGLTELHSDLFEERLGDIICYLLSLMAPEPVASFFQFTSVQRDSAFQAHGSDQVASQASELLLTLMEAFPALFLKTAHLPPPAVSHITDIVGSYMGALVHDVDDDLQKWLNSQPAQDDNDGAAWGSEALSRFALAAASVDPGYIRGSVKALGAPLLKVKDWRCANSVIVAFSSITKGCQSVMDPVVDYRWLKSLQKHSDPRVRHAWLELTYQQSVHLKGRLQQWLFQDLVADCNGLLQDAEPRVRAHAARCLHGVFQPDSRRDLFIFRDEELTNVVQCLFVTYDRGPLYVQQDVLKTLCAVAVCFGSSRLTSDLYCRWMDKLLTKMGPDGERENTALAIANATTLSKSTSPPLVHADKVVEVVEQKKADESTPRPSAPDLPILTPIMVQYTNGLDELAEEWSILLKSWLRIAKTMQESFAPLLPIVIPRLLVSASVPLPENADEDDSSTKLDDQAEALTALATLAKAVPAGFFPYFANTWVLAIQAMRSKYPDAVKLAALPLITELVRLGQRNGITNDPSSLGALWKNINEGVVLGPGNKASDIPEVTAASYETLRDIMSILGTVPYVGIAMDIFASARERLENLGDSRRGRHFEEGEAIPDYMQGWEELEAKEDKVLVEMGETCEMLSRVMNSELFTKEHEKLYESITALVIKYKE